METFEIPYLQYSNRANTHMHTHAHISFVTINMHLVMVIKYISDDFICLFFFASSPHPWMVFQSTEKNFAIEKHKTEEEEEKKLEQAEQKYMTAFLSCIAIDVLFIPSSHFSRKTIDEARICTYGDQNHKIR